MDWITIARYRNGSIFTTAVQKQYDFGVLPANTRVKKTEMKNSYWDNARYSRPWQEFSDATFVVMEGEYEGKELWRLNGYDTEELIRDVVYEAPDCYGIYDSDWVDIDKIDSEQTIQMAYKEDRGREYLAWRIIGGDGKEKRYEAPRLIVEIEEAYSLLQKWREHHHR